MSNHTIPLAVLMRAAAVLKTVKDFPSGQPLTVPVWHAAMVSSNELHAQLDFLLKGQEVEVLN